MSVGDSQKDLISVTVSDSPSEGNNNNNNNNSMEKMFTVNNGRERKLLCGLLASFLGEHFSQTFQQDKTTDRCDSYCHSICDLPLPPQYNIPSVVPVCAGLVIALVVVTRTDSGAGETSKRSGQPEVCMTEGCIGQ